MTTRERNAVALGYEKAVEALLLCRLEAIEEGESPDSERMQEWVKMTRTLILAKKKMITEVYHAPDIILDL